MEKKKKIEIAENISSGAEKVERIEKEVKTEKKVESDKSTDTEEQKPNNLLGEATMKEDNTADNMQSYREKFRKKKKDDDKN